MDALTNYVPTKLDDPAKFLIFDQSVALLAMVLFLAGYWVNQPFLGMVVGILMAYWYNKLKAGYHIGYVSHLTFWVAGTPKLKEIPNSSSRYFFG